MAPRKKMKTDVRVKTAHRKLTGRGKQLKNQIDSAMGNLPKKAASKPRKRK
jgi:hypothetical protein